MKHIVTAGATSNTFLIYIQDATSATGAGLTGLVYNSSGLTAYYKREGQSTASAITLVSGTVGTFVSGGFKEVDATNQPGFYEFSLPDAVFSSGKWAGVLLKGATNMMPCPMEFELSAVNLQSANSFITGINGLAPPSGWNTTVAQTGDTYSRLGAPTGASIAADIQTRLATTAYTAPDNTGIGTLLARLPSALTITSGKVDINDKANFSLSSAGVQAVWDNLLSATYAAGSLGAKFKAWTLGTDSKALLSTDAQTGVVLPRVTLVDTATAVSNGVAVAATQAFNNTGQTTNIPAAVNSIATDAISALSVSSGAVTKVQNGLSIYAGGPVSSVTGNVGGNVVGSVGSVATGVVVTTNNDKAGYGLSTSERDSVSAVIESHLLNEGDGQMLINAIVGAIGNTNLSQAAVVAAIRADVERTGGVLANVALDYARRTGDYATPANVSSVGTAVAGLNNVSTAQVTTAAQSALTAQGYTVARAGYMDVLNGLVASVKTALEGGFLALIKAKTDLIRTSVATTEDVQPTLNVAAPVVNPTLTTAQAAVMTKLDSMIEADGNDFRFDVNALEMAPSGGGGGGGVTAADVANELLARPEILALTVEAEESHISPDGVVFKNASGDVIGTRSKDFADDTIILGKVNLT